MRQARFENISLRLARPRDLVLIKRWLAQRDIIRWWGAPIENFREMRLAVGAPDELAQIFMIIEGGRNAIGFISLVHARLLSGKLACWPRYLPLDAFEIGILIADQKKRRLGYAGQALKKAHDIHARFSKVPIYAFIRRNNVASLHLFKKRGYILTNESQPGLQEWRELRYDPADLLAREGAHS